MPDKTMIQELGINQATPARYCRRCHRRLTAKISMESGYGQTCLKKHLQKKELDCSN
jgi:hypothetical protein